MRRCTDVQRSSNAQQSQVIHKHCNFPASHDCHREEEFTYNTVYLWKEKYHFQKLNMYNTKHDINGFICAIGTIHVKSEQKLIKEIELSRCVFAVPVVCICCAFAIVPVTTLRLCINFANYVIIRDIVALYYLCIRCSFTAHSHEWCCKITLVCLVAVLSLSSRKFSVTGSLV